MGQNAPISLHQWVDSVPRTNRTIHRTVASAPSTLRHTFNISFETLPPLSFPLFRHNLIVKTSLICTAFISSKYFPSNSRTSTVLNAFYHMTHFDLDQLLFILSPSLYLSHVKPDTDDTNISFSHSLYLHHGHYTYRTNLGKVKGR